MTLPRSVGYGGVGVSSIDALIAIMEASGIPFRVTSTYRDTTSYHGSYNAVDFAGPSPSVDSPELDAIARFWAQLGPGLLELIYAGPSAEYWKHGVRVSASTYGGVLAIHHNHVHVAATLDGLNTVLPNLTVPQGGEIPVEVGWPGGGGRGGVDLRGRWGGYKVRDWSVAGRPAEIWRTDWIPIPQINWQQHPLVIAGGSLRPLGFSGHGGVNGGGPSLAWELAQNEYMMRNEPYPADVASGQFYAEQSSTTVTNINVGWVWDVMREPGPGGYAPPLKTMFLTRTTIQLGGIAFQALYGKGYQWEEKRVLRTSEAVSIERERLGIPSTLLPGDPDVPHVEYKWYETPAIDDAWWDVGVNTAYFGPQNYTPDPVACQIHKVDPAHATYVPETASTAEHFMCSPMPPQQLGSYPMLMSVPIPGPLEVGTDGWEQVVWSRQPFHYELLNDGEPTSLGAVTSRCAAGVMPSFGISAPFSLHNHLHNYAHVDLRANVLTRLGWYRCHYVVLLDDPANTPSPGQCQLPNAPVSPGGSDLVLTGAQVGRSSKFYRAV